MAQDFALALALAVSFWVLASAVYSWALASVVSSLASAAVFSSWGGVAAVSFLALAVASLSVVVSCLVSYFVAASSGVLVVLSVMA